MNPGHDVILEIAALPVDADLNILDEGWSTVVRPTLTVHGTTDAGYDPTWFLGELKKEMNQVVLDMHTQNGLFARLEDGEGASLKAATTDFMRYAEQFVPHGETPLAGSSVHFDRRFLEKYMPPVDKFYHYRIADVSCVKEFWKRWFPEAGEPPKVKAHRALDDCYASVAEALWYKERLAYFPITSILPPTKEITDEERNLLREIDEQLRRQTPSDGSHYPFDAPGVGSMH